jgi:hypothetical protein
MYHVHRQAAFEKTGAIISTHLHRKIFFYFINTVLLVVQLKKKSLSNKKATLLQQN